MVAIGVFSIRCIFSVWHVMDTHISLLYLCALYMAFTFVLCKMHIGPWVRKSIPVLLLESLSSTFSSPQLWKPKIFARALVRVSTSTPLQGVIRFLFSNRYK